MKFRDRHILVTGSTRNTGLVVARSFLEEGANVLINGRDEESTREAVSELKEAGFERCFGLTCDIGEKDEIASMFERIRERTDRLDVLVNNAVHLGCGPAFLQSPPELFETVLRVNLLGTILVSQNAARMIPCGGSIVNIGSNVARRAVRNRVAYCTSKGGIAALTRSLAVDLAPQGIRVNEVVPGYIRTDRWEELPGETVRRRRKNIPLGREAEPEDVARAVLFLASEDANNITGTRIVVDGGSMIQHLPADVDV